MQRVVLTKAMDLERSQRGEHVHFGHGEVIPFETLEILGKGAFSQVDKVKSLISHRVYARKRMPRSRNFGGAKEAMKLFEGELSVLKRLRHYHAVEFVGKLYGPGLPWPDHLSGGRLRPVDPVIQCSTLSGQRRTPLQRFWVSLYCSCISAREQDQA
jgi:serine/threonine protein kinase